MTTMQEVSPERIRPGQKVFVEWDGMDSIHESAFIVQALEQCSTQDLSYCEEAGHICCKYRIVQNKIWKFCTVNKNRKFYIITEGTVNKVMEIA